MAVSTRPSIVRTRRAATTALALALALGALGLPGAPAQAQAQAQLVEVTGSRLKRTDAETSSPVQVVTRQQIERSGATSMTEVLKALPANNTRAFDENEVLSFTPGAGGVSLRGLGAQATLVLVNGRRVAPFGFASGTQTTFTDVNAIPVEAVERVEVLLDGASAIYGSDAIGGVVNIILRKAYEGAAVAGAFGRSTHGDANGRRASVTFGHGALADDGFNVFGSFSHVDRDPVKASERPMTASADFRRFGLADLRSLNANNLFTTGGEFLGTLPTCTPLRDATAPALDGRCIYDATQHQDVVAKTSRDSLLLAGTLALPAGFELFGDGIVSRTRFAQESPSFSTAGYFATGTLAAPFIPLPPGHPQNPQADATTALRYRFDDLPFMTRVQSDVVRATAGVRGAVAGWEAEAAVLHARSKTELVTTGVINDRVLLAEVLDPAGNARPTFRFDDAGANDPGLMGRLYPVLRDEGVTSTTLVDAKAARTLGRLPGGALGLAVGAELRREKFSSQPDPLTRIDPATGASAISQLGSSSSRGARTVRAVYAEVSAPLARTLEAMLAARVDHYSDFGSATTPKAGLKWKLLPSLALRATYAEGFRAPAITELTKSPSKAFFSGLRDPVLCPTPDVANPQCDRFIEATFGSNPALRPERSRSLTAGIVFEPVPDTWLTFDAFKVKRRNEIASLEPDYVLANEAAFPGHVVRNAAGEVESLNLQYTNLGSTEVWGYDIEAKTAVHLGPAGRLSVAAAYDRLPGYKVASVAGAPPVQQAGLYTQPKERMRLGFTLDKGDWTASITWNAVGGYLRAFTAADPSCPYDGVRPALCKVSSWTTADLFIGFRGWRNVELSLNVWNIDDRAAPLDERQATRFTLFNSQFHNQLGRYVQLGAKYTFR